MAKIKIYWTPTAVKQRNYVFKYWINRNKSNTYAIKLNERIKNRVRLLAQNPEMGKKSDYGDARVLSLGHYSIIYKKLDSQIVIIGFWDNRQDPKKLLSFLKDN